MPHCLWYSHANGESRGGDRRVFTCSCSQCAMREASRTALAMVRATTLPATFESTHRLPSCSSCLFTIPIHSNNAFGLDISRWVPPPPTTHPSNTSRVLPCHVTAQYDAAQNDVTAAASLPCLPYLRYLTTLLIIPSPSLSSPSQTQHPSHLSSLSDHTSTPSARLSTPQHASAQATGSAARYVRQRQGSGVALAVRRSAAARQLCIKGLWRGRHRS
jgi:hypothetical protein